MAARNSIQVGIKVRPLQKDCDSHWHVNKNTIGLGGSQSEPYCFDHVFDHKTSNQEIFDKMARHIIHSTVRGFNGTIFAYGQTASGKTYTMMGEKDNPGVMVLAAKEVFDEIDRTSANSQFLLRGGYIEIYNEKVYDLLNKPNLNQELKIHETSNGTAQVNCEEVIINSETQLLEVLEMGNRARKVSETNMNDRSSRSHAIFRLIIESRQADSEEDAKVTQSVLNLVDLAGSERADQTGARGVRLKEGSHINKSLLFLSTVIQRLSENEDDEKYISYRDTKLTRILQASLGGNAYTSIICTVNPTFVEETQSTLNFAMRAKKIKNKPHVNEIVSDATMMKRLNKEIQDLKKQLDEEKRKNASTMKLAQIENLLDSKKLSFVNSSKLQTSNNQLINRRRTWCAESIDSPSDTSIVDTILPSTNPFRTNAPPSRLKPPNSNFFFTPQIPLRDPVAGQEKTKTKLTEMPIVEEHFEPAEYFNFGDYHPSSMKTPDKKTPKQNGNCFQKLSDSPAKLSLYQHVRMVEEQLESLQEFTSLEENSLYERNRLLEQERNEYLVTKNELDLTKERLLCSQKRTDALLDEIENLTISKQASDTKVEQYETELLELKAKLNTLEIENQNVVGVEFEFETHRNKSKQREKELLEVLDEKDLKIAGLEKQLKTLHAELRQKDSYENDDVKVCPTCEDLERMLFDGRQQAELEFNEVTKKYQELEINYHQICREFEESENRLRMLKAKYDTLEINWQKQDETIATINADYHSLEKQYNELKTIYDSLEYSSSKSTADCARLQCENDGLQDEIQKLKKRIENMQQQLLDGLLVINKKEKEEPETEPELEPEPKKENDCPVDEQQLMEMVELRCENEKLKMQSNQLETQLGQLQLDYDELSTNVMESVDENEKLMRKIKNLEEELKASAAKIASMSEQAKFKDKDLTVDDNDDDDDDNDDDDAFESNQVEHVEFIEFGNRAYIPINASVKSQNFVGPYKLSLGQWKNTRKQQIKATIVEWKEPHEDFVAINKTTIQYLNETNENLENLVESLKAQNEALFESSQRNVRELRDEIKLLTAELMEKSVVLEDLVKERAEISLLNEELQIKVAMSRNNSINNDGGGDDAYSSSINETICQLPNMDGGGHMIEKSVAETSFDDDTIAINTIKNQLMEKDKECNQLKLEMLQKLQLAESEFRSHLRKYNAEWEESHRKYRQRIKELEEILIEKGITIKTELPEENQSIEMPFHDNEDEDKDYDVVVKVKSEEYNENYATFRRDDKTSTPEFNTPPTNRLMKEVERARLERSAMVQECNDQLSKLHIAMEESKNNNIQLCFQLTEKDELLRQKNDLIENLKLQFDEVNEKYRTELNEKEMMKRRKAELEADLRAYQNEINEQQKLQDEIQKELKELQSQYKDLEGVRDRLKTCIHELDDQKKACINLENRLDDILKENQDLQKQFEESKKSNQDLESKCEQKIKINESLQSEVELLRKDQRESQETIDKMAKQITNLEELDGERCRLEAQLIVVKSDYAKAEKIFVEEKESLVRELDACTLERKEFKEKSETFELKVEELNKELRESIQQGTACLQKALRDHEITEKNLQHATMKQAELENEIATLKTTLETLRDGLNSKSKKERSEIENMSGQLEQLQAEHAAMSEEKAALELEANELRAAVSEAHKLLKHRNDEVESQFKELQFSCASLTEALAVKTQEIEQRSQEAQREADEHTRTKAKLDHVQNELKEVHARMGKNVNELNELNAKLEAKLNEQQENCSELRKKLAEKESDYGKAKLLLENKITKLQCDNRSLTERLEVAHDVIKKRISGDVCESANNSVEIGTQSQNSPRSLSSPCKTPTAEDKFHLVHKERRHRRLSTHDENRRQSAKFQFSVDASTSTDEVLACECDELRRKLSECETQVYIRQSQVTALNLELRNHPLKAEKVQLVKRIQQEQEKSRLEIKKLKTKISEQAAKIQANIATLPFHVRSVTVDRSTCMSPHKDPIDIETQTDMDIDQALHKLQSKYNDLKRICRFRYTRINDLEKMLEEKENIANCQSPANQQNSQTSTTDKSSHKGSSERHKPKHEDLKK